MHRHYHPTPPYYNHTHTEVFAPAPHPHSKPIQRHHNHCLATPSSSFPGSAIVPHDALSTSHIATTALAPALPAPPAPAPHPPSLAINTKSIPAATSGPASAPVLSSRKQQQQTVAQLATFASHMVCYMLYGHHSTSDAVLPASVRVSTPSSPLPNSPHHNLAACCCPACLERPCSSSSSSSCLSYSPPTHERTASDVDKIRPKPMFRKFCLDVLSATLLSPSVILLSLKYIQKLMINLRTSNKIVNTGDGAEYRFFTGALILANKFLDDNTFTNKTWADITGMKIRDINHLEMQFLNGIDFKLFTSQTEYSEWLAGLTQFTSKYMPTQYLTAKQHQTAAAQAPISPVDPATILATEI
ncbi:hypothetical protein BG004_006210, partial [Podila humilis]